MTRRRLTCVAKLRGPSESLASGRAALYALIGLFDEGHRARS
ncbi:MAG TPA: hypothetical protein VIY52_30190 [Streptosporangiaceae bacterium]